MKSNLIKFGGISILLIIVLNSCNESGDEPDPCLNGPTVVVDNIIASVEGKDNGEISVSATKGQSPYQFSIDGANFQSSGTFSDLAADDYTITVIDANGCTNTASAKVDEIPEVFYANEIRPIIDANCQRSPCHGSNPGIPTFATYDDVKSNADRIKERTSAKTMPPSAPLPDNEIALIASWVDQGAQNN